MSGPRWGLAGRRAPSGLLLAALAWFGVGTAAAREDEPEAAPGATTAASEPASDGRVVELNERGSVLYVQGDYRRAVELFLQAYAVGSDPNLLFNIAACYEGLGDRDAALEKYRAFLADPNADPEGRPRAEGAIARLLADEQAAASLPAASEPAAVVPPAPSTPAAPAPVPAGAGQEANFIPEPLPEWLPWAVIGSGAALGVAGLSIYMWGVADHREVTQTPGYDDPNAVVSASRADTEELVDSGDTKKLIGASTAALGGAVIVGYVLWRALERPDDPEPPAVNVGLSPSAASLSWSGRF